jgi:hypothetical protein
VTTDRPPPLDAEEAEIAAIYRRLPAASPDAELDAHILAQSRAAIARDRRRLPPALRWTLGSAAAAVVTVGLAWQIGQMGQGPRWSRPAPPAPSMSAPAADVDAAMDRVELEYLRREKSESPTLELQQSPPPEPEAVRERAAAQRSPTSGAPPAATGQLLETAPPPPPAPPPAAAPAAAIDEAPPPPLDRIEVTGSRIRSDVVEDSAADSGGAASAVLPPVRSDYRLPPRRWLERIRERVDAGDRDGATRSLHRFVRDYPYLVVPEDLAVLLRE